MNSNKALENIYISLFSIAYVSVYINYNSSKFFIFPILLISYYFIIVRKRVEPVLFLILASKFLVGFAVPLSSSAYVFFNVIVNYLPVALFILFNTFGKNSNFFLYRYKFTFAYLFLAFLYSFPLPELALQLVIKEYLPLLLFVLTSVIFAKNIDYGFILNFLKPLLICTLIVYLIPGRFETNIILHELPLLNRVPSEELLKFISIELFRNGGFFWDTRLMGSICYIFIYLSIIKGKEVNKTNILIGALVLLSTFSRGPILIGVLLIITYLYRELLKGRLKTIMISTAAIIFISTIPLNENIKINPDFLSSFLIFNEDNALSQRSGFRDYALDAFYKNPFGNGNGSLKGVGPDRNIDIKGGSYHTVNDAFLFSKLGEMGFIGFLFFLLSIGEIILSRNIYSIILFGGILIQLMGTDLPDTKQFYFVYLMLISKYHIRSSMHN